MDDVEKNLASYFDGLVARNIEKHALLEDLVKGTEARFRKLEQPDSQDLRTFAGTVHTVDDMGKESMALNPTVHVRQCPGTDHAIIFHQFSPQEKRHPYGQSRTDYGKHSVAAYPGPDGRVRHRSQLIFCIFRRNPSNTCLPGVTIALPASKQIPVFPV